MTFWPFSRRRADQVSTAWIRECRRLEHRNTFIGVAWNWDLLRRRLKWDKRVAEARAKKERAA